MLRASISTGLHTLSLRMSQSVHIYRKALDTVPSQLNKQIYKAELLILIN
jgi:hypothetical protein